MRTIEEVVDELNSLLLTDPVGVSQFMLGKTTLDIDPSFYSILESPIVFEEAPWDKVNLSPLGMCKHGVHRFGVSYWGRGEVRQF